MYNANYPKENELPSSKQLLASTLIALIVASVLLVTTILPAEYGIDPTGIGKTLGLTKMGEIKNQLAKEAKELVVPIAQKEDVSLQSQSKTTAEKINKEEALPSESSQVTLAPGATAEIKVTMNTGQVVLYKWKVDTGHVNFDTHGDNAKIKYHSYNKGKAVKGDEGELKAAFNGKHGWFWRNRSHETVVVTLHVSGEFTSLERLL